MTSSGLVFVPLPVAIPTNCTKKVTSTVHADAKTISGNVSLTNCHQIGSDHICTGINVIRVIMASNSSFRNYWKERDVRS